MGNEHHLVRPELDGKTFYFPSGETGVLLFHGFTATTAEVRLLANIFVKEGYSVMAPLLPGHGTRPEDLNRVKWHQWIDTVSSAYLELRKVCSTVVVGGESMGALIALYLASQYPEIRCVVLYAPALSVPALRGVGWVAPFRPVIDKKHAEDDLLWQGYPVYPLKGCVQLIRLQRKVRRLLPKITQPIRIYQGRLDQTIDSRCGQEIIDSVKSTKKDLVWMERSHHCIILDHELQTVANSTIAFIGEILKEYQPIIPG